MIVDFSEEMEATPTLNLVGATTNNDLPLTLDQTNPKRYRHTLSIPAGDGLVQVSLHGADSAGNQVQTVPTSGDNFTLDNTAPTGSLTFSSPGAQDGYTNTNSVNIQFTAQDAFGIAAYLTRLDNASVPEISDFIDTIAPTSISLSQGDGSKTIYGWAMDTTGNIGGPFTDNITLDTQPPVLAILDGPDEYTNESTLTVSISLDGTSDLSLTGSCGVQSFMNQSTGSLDLGNLAEGTYSDCGLEAFDLAANGSGIQNIPTFTVDRTAPSFHELILDGGASETEMENITIELNASDSSGIEQYCVKETASSSTPSISDECWQTTSNSSSTQAMLMSKYERHQNFSNHTWISRNHPIVNQLTNGTEIFFLCNGNQLGPFTVSGLNTNDGNNILEGEGRLAGSGDGLAFFSINGSMSGCQANSNDFLIIDSTVTSESFALSELFNIKQIRAWLRDRAGNISDAQASIERLDPNRSPIIGFGNSLLFDGIDDFISVQNPPQISGDITIEVWLKTNVGNQNYALGKYSGSDETGWLFLVNNQKAQFDGRDGSGNYHSVISTENITDGNWHHIAMQRSGTIWKIMVDGGNWSENNVDTQGNINANQPLAIGALHPDGSNPFNGGLDEVRIWNRALDRYEILERMHEPLDLSNNNYSDLEFYADLNEEKGAIARDSSTHGNDGTLSNMSNESWVNSTIPLRYSILENPVAGAAITSIPVSDPDTGDTVTLSLSGTDAASFEISQSGELNLAATATIDYETDSQFDLIVSASDGKLSVDQQVVINVQDLPETSGEYALNFDGIDDKVSIPFSQSLQNDNITISAWVKPDELSQNLYTVVGFQEAFNLKLEKSNHDYKISVHIKTSNGDWSSGFSNTDVALEKWNHIAASYDGNSVQLYLNGVADGSFVKTGNLITSGGMSIGSRDINSEYFDGLIDDVQIWNKALSASEIQDRMYRSIDQTDTLWSDLSAYYRMDWGEENIAYDYSANANDGALTKGPEWVEAYSWERGMVAHYPLNSNARDVEGNHSGALNGANPTEDRNGYTHKGLSFDGLDDNIEITESSRFEKNSHTISLWVKADSFSSNWVSKDGESSERQWLIGSINTGQIRTHVWTTNGIFYKDSLSSLSTGSWNHVVQTWDGQKLSLYVNGSLDNDIATSGTIVTGDQPVRIAGGAISGAAQYFFNGDMDQVRIYDRPLSTSEVSSMFAYESMDSFSEELSSHYKFNGNTNDSSGNNNHGIGTSIVSSSDRFGENGKAFAFHGNAHINFNFQTSADNTFSWNFWIKDESSSNAYRRWLTTSNSGHVSNTVNVREQASGRMALYAASLSFETSQINFWKDGQWHMLTVVSDGTKTKLYYDSHFLGEINGSVTPEYGLFAGGYYAGGEYLEGSMDDIRIYDNALSHAEIKQLYELEKKPHQLDSVNDIALWLDATNIDGKQNTTLTNGSNVSEWKDLSDYELNFTASGSIYKKNDGNDYVELNDQADILVSERNSSFSGKEFSIQMFAVVELDQDYNQQFGTILGQFGDSSDAASATKSLSFGIGYPQGAAGETSMYTDSWTPVGSKTDSNVQKNQTTVVSYGIDRWYDHESRASFELNGDNLTSATYKSITSASMQDGSLKSAPFEIGNWDTSRGDMIFKGKIREILVFDRIVNQSTKIEINHYLAEKWNLTTSVDSDGDGFTDAVERGKGTSPIDSSDKPSDLPAVLADAKLWLDAENIDGEGNANLENGDPIVEWKDLSGNGNNAAQSTVSNQPSLGSSYQNNNNVLSFTNTDELEIPHNESLSVGDQNYGIFHVVKKTGNNTLYLLSKGRAGHNGTNYRRYYTYLTDSLFGHEIDEDPQWYAVETSQNFNGEYRLIYTERNDGYLNNYVDGVLENSTKLPSGYGSLDETSPTSMLVGGKPWGSTTSNMDLAEILMFKKALSQSERIQVIRHLSTKWGLELTVDSDNDGIVDVHDLDPIDPNKWMVMPSVLRESPSDSYTPMSELELWYDASNTDGENNLGISSGGTIEIWRDLSGNANHVTQSTNSKKPILTTNSNKQYLSFDGSDDSLAGDFAGHVLDDPSGQNVTIFTVVKPKGGLYILSTGGQAGNSKGYALSYQDYGGINSFSIFRDSSGSREFSIVDSFEANDIHLVTHSYSGSYSNTHVLIDGESSGNNYSDSSGASTNDHQELTIGRPPGYENYYGNFEIAEVIVISSTDSQKIIDIQYHLSSKWGLTATVDSDGDGALDALEIEKGSDPKDASDTPFQALPALDDLQAQYRGTGPFTMNGSNIVQWNDISGNNRHITTYRGTPYQTTVDKSLFGLAGTGNINVVQGDENSGFALPFALTSGSYTIAYMARYIGDKDNTEYNKRIFDARSGTGQNTLWGFHSGYAGRSHNGQKGWLTYTDHKMSDPDTWLVGVETEISARFNGKDFTNNYLHSNGNNYPLRPSSGFNPTLSINYGHYTGESGSSEISRWQVAELIIWNRELK